MENELLSQLLTGAVGGAFASSVFSAIGWKVRTKREDEIRRDERDHAKVVAESAHARATELADAAARHARAELEARLLAEARATALDRHVKAIESVVRSAAELSDSYAVIIASPDIQRASTRIALPSDQMVARSLDIIEVARRRMLDASVTLAGSSPMLPAALKRTAHEMMSAVGTIKFALAEPDPASVMAKGRAALESFAEERRKFSDASAEWLEAQSQDSASSRDRS